jgi:hypothetical protein
MLSSAKSWPARVPYASIYAANTYLEQGKERAAGISLVLGRELALVRSLGRECWPVNRLALPILQK